MTSHSYPPLRYTQPSKQVSKHATETPLQSNPISGGKKQLKNSKSINQSRMTPRSRHPVRAHARRVIRVHVQQAAPATVLLAVARAQLVAAARGTSHGGRGR